MTPVQGFDLHPGAAQDIDDIWTFIAADSPVAAGRVRANLLIAIQKLALSPYVGHLRTGLAAGHLRFFRVYEYLIAYAPDERPLLVVGVIHGRRNPRLIREILRERK